MKLCEYCKREFVPVLFNQRFCGAECNADWHTQEKRQALELFRSMGLQVSVPATEEEAA
jgi:hypothetical protein